MGKKRELKDIPEAEVRADIRDWAKANGIIPYKFTSPARRSVPDELYVLPGGMTAYIEVKRFGKKPTPEQYREMEKLRKQGAPVTWVDTVEKGIQFLEICLLGSGKTNED